MSKQRNGGLARMANRDNVTFREIQRPRQYWWQLLVLLIAILIWYGFIQQIILGIPFGDKPAPDAMLVVLWVLFGIVFPVIMLGMIKLTVEVRHDGLYVRFMPFHINYRKFLFSEIEHYELIRYNSVQRFGGWGIRQNLNGETAYNMYGDQGLLLRLNNRTVVIGTQRPDEFKQAMDAAYRTE